MGGVLDFIFDNLHIESLNRKQVMQYLNYLDEIVPQLSSYKEKIKFLSVKDKLDKRLGELDKQNILALRNLT